MVYLCQSVEYLHSVKRLLLFLVFVDVIALHFTHFAVGTFTKGLQQFIFIDKLLAVFGTRHYVTNILRHNGIVWDLRMSDRRHSIEAQIWVILFNADLLNRWRVACAFWDSFWRVFSFHRYIPI
jgi:hypothetical protein